MTSRFLFASITIAAVMTGNMVAGANCGNPWREPCLSDSDPRYKDDAKYDINDQSGILPAFAGFYVCDSYAYGPDSQPIVVDEFPIPGLGTILTAGFPSRLYINYTHSGTRSLVHRYSINAPAPEVGTIGLATALDVYGTSTFELDGRIVTLPIQETKDVLRRQEGGEENTITYMVGNDTTVTKGDVAGRSYLATVTTITCLDAACNSQREITSVYNHSELYYFFSCHSQRITEDEFIAGIRSDYNEFAVPEALRVEVPMTNTSLTGVYPSEEQWCEFDPNCATNPYQEPTTPVKSGVIAGFTIGSVLFFLIVVAIAVYIYNKQQAKRYRTAFAARVAQTMSIRVPARRMDAVALAREFQKIDAQSTADKSGRRASSVGNITKEGMWEFLSSGKAVEMNRHDFEALWAVMDADGSGYVDFLEFCAFMGQCHEEYDNARDNRTLMAERLSRRFSMRLSQIEEDAAGQAADAAATADPENPGGKEKEEDDVSSST